MPGVTGRRQKCSLESPVTAMDWRTHMEKEQTREQGLNTEPCGYDRVEQCTVPPSPTPPVKNIPPRSFFVMAAYFWWHPQ